MLTFTVPHPPITIKAGYLNCKVRPYIPNPVRCFHCQQFGHLKQSCHGSLTCARCGCKDHNATECQLKPHCINCNGTHPSYFTSCPKWVEEKEVQHLKTVNNLTYTDARKLLLPIPSRTYAAVTRSTTSVGVQTDLTLSPTQSSPANLNETLPKINTVHESVSPSISVQTTPSSHCQTSPSSCQDVTIGSPSLDTPKIKQTTCPHPQSLLRVLINSDPSRIHRGR
ncbi:uncharacterized protein LOC143255196 [Tachypleus tridentatus]|uniref:uncharacterized protein LOC143255196 n=1 Tax=Tachypleus tridentatus TaxID=6853 RepID=UPI003FD61CB2